MCPASLAKTIKESMQILILEKWVGWTGFSQFYACDKYYLKDILLNYNL